MQAPSSWPEHLPKIPCLIPSHLRLGFQHMNFGETQTFRPQHGLRLNKSKKDSIWSIIPQRGGFADTLTYTARPVHLMCPAQCLRKKGQYLWDCWLMVWEPDGEWKRIWRIIFTLCESKLPSNPGIGNFFCKGSDNKYFSLCRSFSLCCNNLTQLL